MEDTAEILKDTGHASLAHLLGRLAVVEARVRAAVARRRLSDHDPEDRFRGLYISDSEVDRLLFEPAGRPLPPDPEAASLLAAVEAEADTAERAAADLRLRRLARTFSLGDREVEVLLVALAPDVDPRFERLYAYLHDDVSRRRPSVGLALELCGGHPGVGREREVLQAGAVLVAAGLVVVEDGERPFLTRSLRVPDRVAAHLLGLDAPDPLLHGLAGECVDVEFDDAEPVARALRRGTRLVYVRERPGGAGLSLAAAGLRRAGLGVVSLDLGRLAGHDELEAVALAAGREAGLAEAGLVAGPVEAVAEWGARSVRLLAELRPPVLLVGSRSWDPIWSAVVPLTVEAPPLPPSDRAALWRRALGPTDRTCDPLAATAPFRLSPEQVVRAAAAARQRAVATGRAVETADLHAGARSQNAAGLERLARRLEPQAGWKDLVLPAPVRAQLEELAARARLRERVLDDFGLGSGSSRGRGLTGLFAGESGTGKTLAAEVVAGELGLDLYVIDLSCVIDKYVGETEKNLERIFTEADRINGVLLFDEADAVFGKRSEVRDAHDRYANVEIAYLLQRMERFEGLAVLTTNMRANLDEAFTRRLDVIVDFPMPEADQRRLLWELYLGRGLPCAGDIDLDFLAGAFRLSGGNVRNIVVTAAYLAASADCAVGMPELIRATTREYQKLGRLCAEDEFGPYYRLTDPSLPDRTGLRSRK